MSPLRTTRTAQTMTDPVSVADPMHVAEGSPPKRARTAYNFFSAEAIVETRKEHPEWEHARVLKDVAEKWKGMDESKKVISS